MRFEEVPKSTKSEPRWLKMYVLCQKFYTQIGQVYLQPFRHNSLLKCARASAEKW